MAVRERYLTRPVVADLGEKMVFISGPRQVGKTTLAGELVAGSFKGSAYYNWDNQAHRRAVLAAQWPADSELLIFDEIHKYRPWKRLIKGEYDVHKSRHKFLVTGSSRLDVFRRGGDSLQGRYHHYRLHPFSLAELAGAGAAPKPFEALGMDARASVSDLTALEMFGGFPEPLIRQDERALGRWHNQKAERLFREDIRDLEPIRDLGAMKVLADLLPARAATPLSVNSLREGLEVSHGALTHWLAVLESFHYHFRIHPHARGLARSLKKEAKLYLWDWSEVPAEGARFENLVASHLLKLAHFLHDHGGHKAELRYLRDRAGREVDFLMLVDERPWFAVEAKLSDTEPASNLRYFGERLRIPRLYQVVRKPGVNLRSGQVRIVSADRFLAGLI